jgi:hypothetical protein
MLTYQETQTSTDLYKVLNVSRGGLWPRRLIRRLDDSSLLPPRGQPQAQQSIANRSGRAPRRRASPARSWSSDVMPVGRSLI